MTPDREPEWDELPEVLGLQDLEKLGSDRSKSAVRVFRSADVALKVSLVEREPDSDRRNDLEQEAEILSRCAGLPGVPLVRDLGRHGRFQVLAIDYISGSPLWEPSTDLARFWRTLGNLAFILLRLAWRGIAHNDLKPENILVGPDGTVHVIDFDQASVSSFVTAIRRTFLLRAGDADGLFYTFRELVDSAWSQTRTRSRRSVSILFRRVGIYEYLWTVRDRYRNRLPRAPRGDSELRLLRAAWELAQEAEASSPGRRVAYYEFRMGALVFPGERPWDDRWRMLGNIEVLKGARVLEIGCNMGLFASHLLREGIASAAMGVDSDEQILLAASMAARGLGVEPHFLRVDLDQDEDWETQLLAFEPDVVSVLNVLHWLDTPSRLLAFLGSIESVIFEGHEEDAVEIARFGEIGFDRCQNVGITERGRTVFVFTKNR